MPCGKVAKQGKQLKTPRVGCAKEKVTKAAQLWVFWQGVMYRRQHGIGTSCCSQESAHCWKQSSNMAQIVA
ncbi:TPA: hypothetical protein ACH3X3_001054 [Trebouxia sp. C0006]